MDCRGRAFGVCTKHVVGCWGEEPQGGEEGTDVSQGGKKKKGNIEG